MSSDLLKRKLEYFFTLYDVDQNGFLEPSDFEAVAGHYAEMNGFSTDSEEYKRTLELETLIWNGVRANWDVARDDRLTVEEYVNGFQRWVKTDDFEAYIKEYAEYMFDATDTNKNGTVEFDEFLALIYTEDRIFGRKVFDALDTDGDGALDRAEFIAAFRGFFVTEDEADPVNHLFGFQG